MPLCRLAIPLVLATLAAGPALAGSQIEVIHPWARPTIPNRPGAVYLGIHNTGDTADRLVGARAARAEAAELHKSEEKDGAMTMSPVEAIEIPAGGMAQLGPGGFHLMLFGLEAPLKPGETLDLTLVFQQAGEVSVGVPVAREAPQQGQRQHGTGGN